MDTIKKQIQVKVFWVLLFSFGYNCAQTTNKGMVYVSKNTQFSTLEDFNNEKTGELYNDGEAYIYADFNNEGIINFYQETGTAHFIGNQVQEISGEEPSTFYNVLFNNPGVDYPFHLTGHMEVLGQVDFRQGIVDVDNYQGRFLFDTNAGHVNTSDNSHVDGPVEKYGNTDFTYPIGDKGYYRFAGISAPASTSALYSAKYFYEDPNTLYDRGSREDHIGVIDTQEYWTIEPYAPGEDILITLSWRDATTPEDILAAPIAEHLHIVRWDVQGSIWVDEGGVVDMDTQTITTNVNTFGVFTLARVEPEPGDSYEIKVHNAVTRNGDGVNDKFSIDLSGVPGVGAVHVQIYNRWGVKVFETDDYGDGGDVFDGYSTGRLTVKEGQRLPTGTYFYVLNYQYNEGGEVRYDKQAGYLYLNDN